MHLGFCKGFLQEDLMEARQADLNYARCIGGRLCFRVGIGSGS